MSKSQPGFSYWQLTSPNDLSFLCVMDWGVKFKAVLWWKSFGGSIGGDWYLQLLMIDEIELIHSPSPLQENEKGPRATVNYRSSHYNPNISEAQTTVTQEECNNLTKKRWIM